MAQDVQGQWAHLPGDLISHSDTEDGLTTPKEFLQMKYDCHVSRLYDSCTKALHRQLTAWAKSLSAKLRLKKFGKAIFFGRICILYHAICISVYVQPVREAIN